MKVMQRIASGLIVIMTLIVLLISSTEAAIYGDRDYSFYEQEYEKYQVTEDLDMKLKDVMYVTTEMMAYLRGDRETLSVMTDVGGEERDFFNEQDRLHMEDVQVLFRGGLALRWWCILVIVICLIVLKLWGRDRLKGLCRAYWIGIGIFAVIVGILAFLFTQDFTRYFTVFHEIFFRNDLWMFDPETDLMIRMLPERFFYDMAARIVIFFSTGLLTSLIISIVAYKKK